MKKFLFTLLCFFLFIASFMVVIGLRIGKVWSEPKTTSIEVSPTPFVHDSTPPQQSLSGNTRILSGKATILTRTEDDPIDLSLHPKVLEGEQLIASKSATVQVSFGSLDNFSLTENTILSFPSTNPNNFLVKQDQGKTVFETDTSIATISARSLHGLFTLSQGKAELSTDPDKKIIVFSILEGNGKMGYIDEDNKTQTVEMFKGVTLTFDDSKRIFTSN